MISLSYGGTFDEKQLIKYLKTQKRNFIIIGANKCSFANHNKPQSLDYWLRANGTGHNPNTKQADLQVVQKLIATGMLTLHKDHCPHSGRACKSLRVKSSY